MYRLNQQLGSAFCFQRYALLRSLSRLCWGARRSTPASAKKSAAKATPKSAASKGAKRKKASSDSDDEDEDDMHASDDDDDEPKPAAKKTPSRYDCVAVVFDGSRRTPHPAHPKGFRSTPARARKSAAKATYVSDDEEEDEDAIDDDDSDFEAD
eukprot:1187114-Prorocentrum_minimum.AAC.4